MAGTLTEAGTVKAPLLLLRPTVVAMLGAVFRVRVQVLDAVPVSETGPHTSEVTVVGISTRLAVCDDPFRLAVTVAVALTDPGVVTEN